MSDSPLQIGSQCDRCQYYAFSDYLVCSLHPAGPAAKHDCHDFESWPEDIVLWAPVGRGFYETEALDEAGYRPRLSRQSLREKLEQIEIHPIFSGRCPQCRYRLGYGPQYLWNCDRCGWKDSLEC